MDSVKSAQGDAAASDTGSDAPPATERHAFEFRGTGAEYFRIWIVNLALTIVTLGIYSAWAKVRRLRWFYGQTVLAGSTFAYHGQPLQILKGRAIAAVLLFVYLGAEFLFPGAQALAGLLIALVVPWLVVRSRLFTLRMSAWRGLRFDFEPDYRGAYVAFLGWGLLAILTLGVLYPVFARKRYEFAVSRSRFAGERFVTALRDGKFYAAYLGAAGVIVLGVAAGLAAGALVSGGAAVLGAARADGIGWGMVLVTVLSLAGYLGAFAFLQARTLNEVYGRTALAGHRFESTLRAAPLFGIYLKNIVLIVLTLGLYVPFAQVRLAQYRVESLALETEGSLDAFVAARTAAAPPATGEEISDLFDVDFGL